MKKNLLFIIFIFLSIQTAVHSQIVCGSYFTDPAGPTANYANNLDYTTTICPSTPGDMVTVSFSSFRTEAGSDALYIFNGNSITSPQIASSNGAGFVPGGLTGGFWGTTSPGTFTSTDITGCLTFRFRTDTSSVENGWLANVTCTTPPTCLRPTALVTSSITANSANVGWTENSSATNWEILSLPYGSPFPTAAVNGQAVTTNPATISGLTPGMLQDLYVRSVCSSENKSNWSLNKTITTLYSPPVNDECVNAIVLPVNTDDGIIPSVYGYNTLATASILPVTDVCTGTPDDDVWYQFVATSTKMEITLERNGGTTTNIMGAVYTGTCGSLTLFSCENFTSPDSYINNYVIGQTYFIRVYSALSTPQSACNFRLRVRALNFDCYNAQLACGNIPNAINTPSLGTVLCVNATPNPTFLAVKIATSGTVNLLLRQSTIGSASYNFDIDFVAWGPFASQNDGCEAIRNGQSPINCSYSASPTEQFSIANAVAGQYYIILTTNFYNISGLINVTQTNSSAIGAGSIDCPGLRMNAFLDTNNNGTKESDESNFPLGQFQYAINNSPDIHNIASPLGTYTIYDSLNSNNYNLSYAINQEFSSVYSCTTTYPNVIPSYVSMSTYNFPVTISQNINDVGITIIPLNSPRAGTGNYYKNKIVYTNNGNQTIASGTLTFTRDSSITFSSISQAGTNPISNGFTYDFVNLLPFESRSIIVTFLVPTLPNVSIGQLITNNVSITPASGDLVTNNNTFSLTQSIVSPFDPNDKFEAHGGEIQYSTFSSDDYLFYTIRFQNNGNAPASNIVVTDVLDSKLDESSLVMIDASHNYSLDRVGNSLAWNFNFIMLPAYIANTNTGVGYVNFKIKPKPGYAIGDIIPNSASIFFDTNPAIITNTFNTEFVQSLDVQFYDFNKWFILSPVPAKNRLTISTKQDTVVTSANIYNMLGQLLQVNTNPNETIDVSSLQSGSYFIKIISDKGSATGKFVKE